jgi:hypothetical protein
MVILCFVATSDTQVRYNQDWLVFNANFSNYFSYSVAWHSQENDDGERIHMLWKYLYSLAHIFVVLRNALILRLLNSWFQTLQTTINRKFVFRWIFYFRGLRENHKSAKIRTLQLIMISQYIFHFYDSPSFDVFKKKRGGSLAITVLEW